MPRCELGLNPAGVGMFPLMSLLKLDRRRYVCGRLAPSGL